MGLKIANLTNLGQLAGDIFVALTRKRSFNAS